MTDRQNKKRKKNKQKCITIMLMAITMLITTVVIIIWNAEYTRIDLNKLATVSFTGYNTCGTANVDLKTDSNYPSFCRSITYELSQNGDLKNGDEITLDFEYDKDLAKKYKLYVKEKEEHITVSGLPEAKEVSLEELFQNCKVSYEGIAPEITIQLENTTTDDYLKTVTYELQTERKSYQLGDVFTVIANFDTEEAVCRGYAIEEGAGGYNKEYTITGLDAYLEEVSEISKEQIEELDTAGRKLFGDATDYGLRIFSEANLMPIWVNNKTTFQWSNPSLLSAYLNVLEEDEIGEVVTHQNDLKLVYNVTLQQANGVSCRAEAVVQFTDLIKKKDGTYDLAIDSGKIIAASYKNKNIKELVEDEYHTEYQSQKIELE